MKYECPECNTRFDEDTLSLNAVCTYRGKWFGDNPEPPEYDWKCPDCGYMGENWYEVSACQECGVDYLDGDTHTCEPIDTYDDIPDGLKFMLTTQRMFFDLGAGK